MNSINQHHYHNVYFRRQLMALGAFATTSKALMEPSSPLACQPKMIRSCGCSFRSSVGPSGWSLSMGETTRSMAFQCSNLGLARTFSTCPTKTTFVTALLLKNAPQRILLTTHITTRPVRLKNITVSTA